MGRWKQQDATVCIFGTVNCAFGENTSDARLIVDTHNADCDAYEKRIAELTAEVARVKAESLRVVPVGKQACVYCGGTDIECIHCYGYGKPVVLKRWEEQG